MTLPVLEPRFIAVEGCIGAGKTSLVKLLGNQFDAQVVLEVDEENPFIDKFYQDRETFGFSDPDFFFTEPVQPIYGPRAEGPVQFGRPRGLPVPKRSPVCRTQPEGARTQAL
tara:strand:- start:65 stop:400 length:336 start_codon:yes stop_codon:yes gene_type:complete